MLQQTRVETVKPYFTRWMRLFPTIRKLANASDQDILSAWEGLGYYRRAHNLMEAARILQDQHRGIFPRDSEVLRKLPGIGKYTSAAIASIAFGADEPAVDGNIRRVYARLFDIKLPVSSADFENVIWNIAAKCLPHGSAGDFNQALMELGALVCLPKNPHCPVCPLKGICVAYKRGVEDQRPRKKPNRPIAHRHYAAAVIVKRIRNSPHTLVIQRPVGGLLGGLWEFPNVIIKRGQEGEIIKAFQKNQHIRPSITKPLCTIKHAYTHFHVTEIAYRCKLINSQMDDRFKWIPVNQLEKYPMGKIDRQIAHNLQAEFA